jgi:hypothetical protein
VTGITLPCAEKRWLSVLGSELVGEGLAASGFYDYLGRV